jgi:GNAT superfamily N-acetyltransferase
MSKAFNLIGLIDESTIPTLKITSKYIPSGFGVDDYEKGEGKAYYISAKDGGKEIGYAEVEYLKDENLVHIRWVEVEKNYQNSGVAKAILDYLTKLFPKANLDTNAYTEEGEGLQKYIG